jgi:phosphopantothenoylcysteine decarboxylase/phosphopantothenate--cysteine ligase
MAQKILITSGPTRQFLDPVRYLTNASSGRMGQALARAGVEAGHQIFVVTGPVALEYPPEATVHQVVSTEEMLQTWQPLELHLVETPDVMAALGGRKRPEQWLVGFALETDDLRFRALTKMQKKSCDLMVLNEPSAIDAPDNQVELLDRSGAVIASLRGDKLKVAQGLWREIESRLIRRS